MVKSENFKFKCNELINIGRRRGNPKKRTMTDTAAGEAGPSSSNNTGNTLSTDELESWTLLDSSPRRSPVPEVLQMESKKSPHKESPSRAEDEDEVEEKEVEDAEASGEESASEEEVEVQKKGQEKVEVKEDVKEETSRVEVVQVKSDTRQDAGEEQSKQKKKSKKDRKKRIDSERSVDSSDGISVISDSDAGGGSEKVHLAKGLRLDAFAEPSDTRLRRSDTDEDKQLVQEDGLVPWRNVTRNYVVVLGVFVTAIAAILVGNSRIYTDKIDEYNFQHEQRISELELENNILKNEMNKLKHLYTRTELDEQVQQADSDWAKVLEEKLAEEQAQAEPEPETPTEEPLVFRKVPPQDEDIVHKVVWSGDDGQPMLIADKDYVLPDFCFNKDAVQDALFSEYSGKYCDIKRRKVEAKLRKAEFARKNHKRYKQKDYSEYIIPTQEEIDEYQRQSTAQPPKPPSLSPFEFDYQQAFENIKEEGAVIVDSLVAILDLDPEPEYPPTPSPSTSSQDSSYQADDEASPSPTPSTDSVTTDAAPNWDAFPPWVKAKYANQPEMHPKLRHKEQLLWDWERKKNQFLHEVGLETLEEVGAKSEDELRQRRDEFRGSQPQQQSGERRHYKEEKQQYRDRKEYNGKKYDDRRRNDKERYDERKEWKDRPRSGEERSYDSHQNQQPWKDDKDNQSRKQGEPSKQHEWKKDTNSKEGSYLKESRESSGEGKPPYNKNHASGERKNGGWKESSGDGNKRYKKEWKDGSGEQKKRAHWKDDSGEDDSGEHSREDWKKSSGEQREHWKKDGKREMKRNGDQWNWNKDHSEEDDHSGEGSYLSQYRSGEEHHKKWDKDGGNRKYRDDDDNDDDDDDDHRTKYHGSKEDHHRKHHKDNDDHWKRKKHHDGDRKWQEHSQERRR